MKKVYLLFLSSFILLNVAFSQYWQQDVHYRINCNLDTKSKIITGEESLIYTNNSPDTITVAPFHLYQNSYSPGSYFSKKQGRSDEFSKLTDEDFGWTKIDELKDGLGNNLENNLDNTILYVNLNKPLLPGEKTEFKMKFRTKFSSIRHRLNYSYDEWGNIQFSVAQWYPKICVYDQFRWHDDQDFGHEFYGDFGTFDVSITLPEHFIMDATGVLQNKDEALPDDLLKKIDIRNFKDKPFGEKPGIIIPESAKEKTWKFHAENVHDFAWIADPTFRRGYAEWNGIHVISYAREYKASKWQDAAEFTAKVIEIYSKDFGKYAYPKMIISDVDNGMEYPMLTMDGGESPDYYGLLAHEVGHNWFYGILGNNETREPYMDEGFTQFIESWSMERLTDSTGKFIKFDEYIPGSLPKRTDYREQGIYQRYMDLARAGYENKITTHSDWTIDGNAYGVSAYHKPATMLFNLQYVLGYDMFLNCMQAYFKKWSLKHPHPQDFIDAVQKVSGRELDWFFEQWLNTTVKCDYKIKNYSTKKTAGDNYESEITLYRKGDMIMPLDLKITLDNGKSLNYHIPVDRSAKKEDGLIILPKWTGWQDWNRTYTAKINLPADISKIEIDPTRRLADLFPLDNQTGLPDIELLFFNPEKYHRASLYKLQPSWRPDIWFNDISGIKPGLKLSLNYPLNTSFPYISSYLNLWYGIRDNKLNVEYNSKTPNKYAGNLAYNYFYLSIMEGRAAANLTFEKKIAPVLSADKITTIALSLKHFQLYNDDYILDKTRWNMGKVNSLQLTISESRSNSLYYSNSYVSLKTTIMGTEYDFSKITLGNNSTMDCGGMRIKTRIFAGYTRGDVPAQELFYLSGASPIDEYSGSYPNSYYRSRGLLPNDLVRKYHTALEGGDNLRGYVNQDYSGTRAASFGIALSSTGLTNVFDLFTPYIFYEMGNVDSEIRDGFIMQFFSPFKHDLGAGINMKMPPIFSLIGLNNIRFDFPVWVSNPVNFYPAGSDKNEDNFKFRWLISFNRAF
jgi:hypothetical protein